MQVEKGIILIHKHNVQYIFSCIGACSLSLILSIHSIKLQNASVSSYSPFLSNICL